MPCDPIDPTKLVKVIEALEKRINDTYAIALEANTRSKACVAYISRLPGADDVDLKELLESYARTGVMHRDAAQAHANMLSTIQQIHRISQQAAEKKKVA